ncbi:HAD family hydrolase [Propionicimonas sp.]|uniref:HAD family hydrolase n=1 Tax=Propionicimonas sp. TaxID=1955623 RepID=UPI0018017EE4|nr:HAD-IIIA family hydrolase [Propionicimonas sp.]MBU3978034.1 HAD-IIIA family hydrolase [Actinomycetota bacterium]MBA3021980.1 HAD-IIIA family hydrolase [Propionicimonas sp.]MBU3985524.1 HAD-IIIA family hydrolase [Actinomycetota bacterium]MBU4007687.1 HAD-IIIA family hydrolase [Actinomycetota bacterium]MBU4064462.1 HAD-IIIA family hydrolase [Actinomycetota bacterium]
MAGWRWVVFDLDGTVVNTIPLIIASYDHAMWAILGEHTDPVEARSWIGQTLYHTFQARHPEHAHALIDAYVEFNLREMPKLIERYPQLPELLADLAATGIGLGIATSKRRHSAERTLSVAGLAGAIPVTVAMEDTAVHKPDPAPLRLALDRLGAEAAESVYIGDAVVDVQAAKAAGMAVIAVTWGAGRRDELTAAEPTAVLDTVAELRALLLP